MCRAPDALLAAIKGLQDFLGQRSIEVVRYPDLTFEEAAGARSRITVDPGPQAAFDDVAEALQQRVQDWCASTPVAARHRA